jgi:hypothetical protein
VGIYGTTVWSTVPNFGKLMPQWLWLQLNALWAMGMGAWSCLEISPNATDTKPEYSDIVERI